MQDKCNDLKSFTRTCTIRNRKLAETLIAEENLWGVSTSLDKRNKMSMLGIISYILFLPQIYFYIYNIWIFITTGAPRWCELEQVYITIIFFYYTITLYIKRSNPDDIKKEKFGKE